MSRLPIHIIHIVPSFGIGGMENGIVNLINCADSSRFAFSICSFSPECDSLQRILQNKVPFYILHKQNGNDWRLPFHLAQVFRDHEIDIVHTHGWGTYLEGLLAAKLAGIPTLIHGEHGLHLLDRRRRILAYRIFQYATDQIVTVSHDLRDRFVNKFKVPSYKVKHIMNGVNAQMFSPDAQVRQNKRKELMVEDDRIVVGAIGRLCEDKDYHTLLRAIALVVQSVPHVCLLIIGEGEQRAELQRLSDELKISDYVRFLGMRTDVPGLLNAMDIFALTSIREGIPNTILEAMCAKLPIVATNVGGIPEVVVDGKTGLVVNTQQAETVADALIKLILCPHLRLQMGEAGQRRVQAHFRLESMVQAYERTYLEVIKAKDRVELGSQKTLL